jgi:hypothetical protein
MWSCASHVRRHAGLWVLRQDGEALGHGNGGVPAHARKARVVHALVSLYPVGDPRGTACIV